VEGALACCETLPWQNAKRRRPGPLGLLNVVHGKKGASWIDPLVLLVVSIKSEFRTLEKKQRFGEKSHQIILRLSNENW